VIQELQKVKNSIEAAIFNENIDIAKKPMLVARRNTIQNFIDLPDDLIQQEMIEE
jgi:hypothetical protein